MKSKRNLVVGLLLAGAAVIALGSVAVASGGHKGKDNDRHAKKIVVVERATTDTPIDNAPVGEDSIGDTLAFGNQLFDKTNTMMVGTDQGSCVRTVVGVAYECTWSNSLKGGQIMVEGPFLDAGDSVLAITGGTGKYRDVTGTMDLHAIDATSFMFTFHIHH